MIRLKYHKGSDGKVRARILCSLEEAEDLFFHAYIGAREGAQLNPVQRDPIPHKLRADKYAELMAHIHIKLKEIKDDETNPDANSKRSGVRHA